MVISKKIMAKLEKENNKLNELNKKRDEIIKAHLLKLEEIDKQIKAQTKIVDEIKAQEKAEKLDAIAVLMNRNGISVDTLYNAVASGDLYGIQEALEKGDNSTVPLLSENKDDAEATKGETSSDTSSVSTTSYGYSPVDNKNE